MAGSCDMVDDPCGSPNDRRMSLVDCAEMADQQYATYSLSLERLSQSESQTRAKMTQILLVNQKEHGNDRVQKLQCQLTTHKEKVEHLAQSVDLMKGEIALDHAKFERLEEENRRLKSVQKKLEVTEAHNGTLMSERAGLTAELTVAQAQIRKLYKELQARKNQKTAATQKAAKRDLLAPPGLWEVPSARKEESTVAPPGYHTPHQQNMITVAAPVLPKLAKKDGEDSDHLEVLLTADQRRIEPKESLPDAENEPPKKSRQSAKKVSATKKVLTKKASAKISN